jgi:hypothetical protein
MTQLTLAELEASVPPNLKSSITQDLVDSINNLALDPEIAKMIRENMISYSSVLKDGKFKIEDYLHAVMYVSYQLMGQSNLDAWAMTHPDRYQRLVAKGTSSKDMAAYVSAYNKGKLVNLIREQSLVPTWVLNAHLFQQALNVNAVIMNDDDVSPKVRVEAANSILTHLKRPEAVKATLDINVKDESGVTELKNALRELSMKQVESIKSGTAVAEIAASPIIPSGGTDGSDQAGAG